MGQPPLKPWQRQPNESSLAFEAFVHYRDMGPSRSTRRVAETLGKSPSVIEGWCSANKWVFRCHAWDNELDKRSQQAQIQELKSMKRRQIRMAVEMQSAAGIALKALNEKLKEAQKRVEETGKAGKSLISPDHIVRLADAGARLERLNQDAPDQILQVQQQDFSNLSTDEMLQLRLLLTKAQS